MNPTEQLISQKFQQYYLTHNQTLYSPPNASQREYGFLLFKEKFMVRHRAFKDSDALLKAIRDLAPAHVYFSTAYYQDPTASMDQKGWLGADLVFDIDADHLDTPCKIVHDDWKCKGCGAIGKGSAPKVCPKCKNDRMEVTAWLCDRCLQEAKEETISLLDMIFSDLQLGQANLRVYFSGHRGYHIHLYSEAFQTLREEQRRELVNYLLGQDLDPALQGMEEVSEGGVSILRGPQWGDPGWRGRIVRGIYEVLTKEGANLGLNANQLNFLRSWDKDNLFSKPFWSSLKGINTATWRNIVQRAIGETAAKIDTVVTTDVHRLIRLPGTLNGHTGLLGVDVPLEGLDEFDPFRESLAFSGVMRIRVKDSPKFDLGGNQFGPYHNEEVELPSYAAMLLLCKRRAEPMG